MKLSDKQKEVIRLMMEGWELHKPLRRVAMKYWLQNRVGPTVEDVEVFSQTFYSLWRLGMITMGASHQYSTQFILTEKGKSIDL